MSISLATKGIIAQFAPGGGGSPIYVPMEEPNVMTDEVGSIDIHGTSLEAGIRGKVIEPSLSPKELKPKMKAEGEE